MGEAYCKGRGFNCFSCKKKDGCKDYVPDCPDFSKLEIEALEVSKMYKSAIALEDLDNYSICVLMIYGIRKMQREEDIEQNLVYVNVIPPSSMGYKYKIKQDEMVRYIPINVMPKFTLK